MFLRICLFIVGFCFMIIGNFYLIVYINLFSLGYTIGEYFCFVLTRYECYYAVIGLVLILLSIYKKGDQ